MSSLYILLLRLLLYLVILFSPLDKKLIYHQLRL